jgi:hypothetical protein
MNSETRPEQGQYRLDFCISGPGSHAGFGS